MNVIFQTKSKTQNRYSLGAVEGYGNVLFNKGVFITSDKGLIKKLISHPMKKRGDYFMVTNDILVSDYLDGKESDKLNEEVLNQVTLQGIYELGKITSSKETQPTLIKIELVGTPISNEIQKVLDYYKVAKTTIKQEIEEMSVPGEIAENLKSTDLGVLEAVNYIERTPLEDLKDFVTKDETRVTVIKAWKKKNK